MCGKLIVLGVVTDDALLFRRSKRVRSVEETTVLKTPTASTHPLLYAKNT